VSKINGTKIAHLTGSCRHCGCAIVMHYVDVWVQMSYQLMAFIREYISKHLRWILCMLSLQLE